MKKLSIDLLISHLQMIRLESLESCHLKPFVGSDAFGSDGITTAMDVYQSKDEKYTTVQLRSPVYKVILTTHSQHHGIAFAREWVDWILSRNFKAIVFLSGADSSRKPDGMLKLRYFTI